MQKKRLILIILVLILSLLTAAFYYFPLTPLAVTGISAAEQGQNVLETHFLAPNDARELLDALQGSVEKNLPEEILASFDLILHLKIPPVRRYEVYVTSARDVYLKRAGSGRFICSKKPRFFYTHEAFQSLYTYGQMPHVLITTARGEEIVPRAEERSWQFLKWDDKWYDGVRRPMSASAPERPVLSSAEEHLALQVDPLPDSISLQVTDPAGATVFDGSLNGGQLPVFQYNGLYKYRLSLSWHDESRPYRGRYEGSFSVMMELPPVFEVPDTLVQGELAAFYVRHVPRGVMPVLELEPDLAHPLRFFPHEDGYVAYLPTHYGTAPGEYRLACGLEGGPLQESTLTVRSREFHIQHLRVDAGIVASTRNEAAYEQFNRYFPQARENSADERYYNEPFMLPVSGRLTTEFGQTRYVNNAPTSYRHSGLDIAAPTGTPVLAANNGRVTLAMDLILTGNTVVLDHGQGLFSIYYHMHELVVEEGQFVRRGEPLGTVGSTGFSTGPHLHFTMSYFTHNLEPGYFLVGEPITYENARLHLQGQ